MVSPALMGAPTLTGTSVPGAWYGSEDQFRLSTRSASITAWSVRQGLPALPLPPLLPFTGST